jgi:hypothetical protein
VKAQTKGQTWRNGVEMGQKRGDSGVFWGVFWGVENEGVPLFCCGSQVRAVKFTVSRDFLLDFSLCAGIGERSLVA